MPREFLAGAVTSIQAGNGFQWAADDQGLGVKLAPGDELGLGVDLYPTAPSMTVISVTRKLDSTLRGTGQWGYKSNTLGTFCGALWPFSDGNGYFDFGGATNGISRLVISSVPNDQKYEVLVFRVHPVWNMAVFRNGALLDRTANAPVSRSNDGSQAVLNRHDGAAGGDNRHFYMFAIFNVGLSDDLCRALSINPWGIFSTEQHFNVTSPVNIYTYVASGGMLLAGQAPFEVHKVHTPSGGLTLGGAADAHPARVYTVPTTPFPPGSDLAFAGTAPVSFSKKTGSAIVYVGSYRGDGASSQSITSIPFTPLVVWVMGIVAGGEKGAIKIRGMATNKSHPWKNDPAASDTARDNRILTLDTSGFTVGTDLNSNGDTFFFIAFPEVAGATAVGSYVGTGSLVTTTLPFTPDLLMLLADDAVGAPTPAQFLPGAGVGDFALGTGNNQNFQGDGLSPAQANVIATTLSTQNQDSTHGYSKSGVTYRWFALKADETKIAGFQKLDYTGDGVNTGRDIEPPLDFPPTFWMDFAANTATEWKDSLSGLQSGTDTSKFTDGQPNQNHSITILQDGFHLGSVVWNANTIKYRAFMARTVTSFDLKFGGAAEYSYFNGSVTKYFHEGIGGLRLDGDGAGAAVYARAAEFIVQGVVDQGTVSPYGHLWVILMQNYFPYNDPPRVPIRTMEFWVDPTTAAMFSGGQLWTAVLTPRITEAVPSDPFTMDYTVLESVSVPYNTLPGLAGGSHTPPVVYLGSFEPIANAGAGKIPRLITLYLGQDDRMGTISDYPLGAIWRVTLYGPM